MLQVARFLFKSLAKLQKGGKLAPSVEYLTALTKGSLTIDVDVDHLGCPFFVNRILKNFACVSVKNMALKLSQGVKEGLSEKEAWDTYAGISLSEAATVHSIFIIHGYYLDFLQKITDPCLKKVMSKLCALFGIEKLIERASQVYETGILTPEAFQMLNAKREILLSELRPEALTLMEAF